MASRNQPGVRVGAGTFKGRALRYPSEGGAARDTRIRPTASRTKESVFNALQDEVRGGVFVDLYAAAGGVGIEALSRGAAFVHFVERDPAALAALELNLSACGVGRERYRIHRMDVARFLSGGGLDDTGAGVVYADPPYEASGAEIDSLLALLDEKPYPHVRFLVVEHGGALAPRERRRWRLVRTRRFGDTSLTYFTPTEGTDP